MGNLKLTGNRPRHSYSMAGETLMNRIIEMTIMTAVSEEVTCDRKVSDWPGLREGTLKDKSGVGNALWAYVAEELTDTGVAANLRRQEEREVSKEKCFDTIRAAQVKVTLSPHSSAES